MIAILRALACATILFATVNHATDARAAGALAIGACGAYGYAYDFLKLDRARAEALKKCSGECQAVEMRKSCAAYAIDGANACGAHGYAVAGKLAQAQNVALRRCYEYGGRECMIRAFACDERG